MESREKVQQRFLFSCTVSLILIWCLSLISPAEARVGVKRSTQTHAANEVLVKFKAGVTEDTITSVFRAHDLVPSRSVRHKIKSGESLSGLAQKYMKDVTRFGAIAKRNKIKDANKIKVGQILKIPSREKSRIRRIDVHSTKIPAGKTVSGIIKLLKARNDVLYAEPNYLHQMAEPPYPPALGEGFGNQWGLSNTGQFGGTPNADINAIPAWNIERGSSSTIIAVIDTGIDLNHEDLTANIWSNPGEIPGNGIDDDGNGLVDDERGWDFSDDDNLPADYAGHGTHVAGIIAAVGDNSLGISGVCRNCRIMPLKIFPNAYSDICAQAIIYAADNGARVLSNSWGGDYPSSVIRDAISYANSKGVLSVFAAGNNNTSNPFYPAYYPEVLAVAATDDSDKKASFSNFGDWIDVSAPGNHIYSSVLNNGYGFMDGTSMACPFVSGLAGLIISQDPSLTAGQLRSRIENSAHSIDSLNPGYEGLLGSGRIDAYSALTTAPDTSPPTGNPTTPADAGEYSQSVTITFNWTKGSSEDPESGISGYYLQVGTYPGGNDKFDGSVGDVLSQSISGCEDGKTYYARVRAINGAGLYGQWSANSDGITIQAVAVGEIEINYTFSHPQFVSAGGGYWRIKMEDTLQWRHTGEPVVPMRTAKILIPQGEEVENIFVVPGNKVPIQGNYKIDYGRMPTRPGLAPVVTEPNYTIYQSTSPFPGELKSKGRTHFMVGYRILVVNLFPLQYIPASDELYYYESLKIVVDTVPMEREPVGIVPCRNVQTDVSRVQRFVDNPNLTQSYTKKVQPQTSYDYVIITTDSLVSAFEPLITQKQDRGYTARIVTTTWIYATYSGEDDAAKIRDFIKTTAYPDWGATYILLGGDTDDTGDANGGYVIPHRGMRGYVDTLPATSDTDIPADIYFAGLDATGGTYDWDNDGDGIYGEGDKNEVKKAGGASGDEADFLAEVFVGRMCVETVTEVTNMVNKTIAYENQYNPQKALLVGEVLDATTAGGEGLEEIWTHFDVSTWTKTRIFQETTPREYVFDDGQVPELDVQAQLNSGTNHLVLHDGHSNRDFNMGLDSEYAALLTNTTYFFGYTLGCYSFAFDNYDEGYGPDCVGENFTVKNASGAFAFIGGTRYGWYWSGIPIGPGGEFMREFIDNLFGGGIANIARSLQNAKEDMIGEVEATDMYRWEYFSVNINGDPETPLRWGVDTSSPTGFPTTPVDEGAMGASTLKFTWSTGTLADPQSGISGFMLQVSSANDYWNPERIHYSEYLGPVTTGYVSNCLAGMTYFARVRGKNSVGMYSAYSGVSNGIEISAGPDFEVTSSDIEFCPLTPAPDEVFTTSATIHNKGGGLDFYAESITDQDYWYTSYANSWPAGYFVADYDMELTKVELLGEDKGNDDTARVRIRNCDGAALKPATGSENILATETVNWSASGWQTVEITDRPILNAGATYWICLENDNVLDHGYWWSTTNKNAGTSLSADQGASWGAATESPADFKAYGVKTTSGTVKFYAGDPQDGGVQIGTTQNVNIPPAGQQIVSVDWSTGTAGDYLIYVWVDSNPYVVSEPNESNNLAYNTVTVQADSTPPGKIANLSAYCPEDYKATLSWTSPGDDGFSGQLLSGSQYKIQYSLYDGGWSTASAQVTIDAEGANPTDNKSHDLENLLASTTYYFKIWTCDEIPNWSSTSTIAQTYVTGPDIFPPAPVADLSAETGEDCGQIALSWTAPGDDENEGFASEYFVKYATYVITSSSHADKSDTDFDAGTFSSTTIVDSGDAAYLQINSSIEDPGTELGPESFEDTVPPSGWSVENYDSSAEHWKRGAFGQPEDPSDGSYSAIVAYDGTYTQDTWLITPVIDLGSHIDAQVIFNIDFKTATYAEHLEVRVSVDGGDTWPDSRILHDYFHETKSQTIDETLDMDVNFQSNVKLAFRYWTAVADQNAIGIDYVRIRSTQSVSFSSATWTSPVLSADTTAAWKIKWTSSTPAGTSVSAVTRTGNTATPDGTWSDWSEEITNSAGQVVPSPDAKHIQYKAILRSDDPPATPDLNDITLTHTTWWFLADDAAGEPAPELAGTASSMTISGLTPGDTYYFAMRADDDAGNLSFVDTNAQASVTQSSAIACILCPPADLQVSTVYTSSITVVWSTVTYPFEDGYVIEASSIPDFTGTVHSSATASVNLSTLTVLSPALYSNTTYYLRVGATYGGTTAYAATEPSTSTLANPVEDAQIFDVSGTSVTVNWKPLPPYPPATSSATSEGYIVIASSKNFDGTDTVRSSSTVDVTLSTLTVQNLWDNTTYYFRVGSLNWYDVPNFVFVSSVCTVPDTGDGTGFASFDVTAEEIIDASTIETLTITGNGQKELKAVSIEIPYTWTWTGEVVDVSTSGVGFSGSPDITVTGLGESGDPYVITIGQTDPAAITDVSSGVVTISNLTAPGTAGAAADNKFIVKTKCTNSLAEIVSSPGIAVYGTLTLGTDGTWNPSGEVLTGGKECLIAAFTLSANEENVAIQNFTVKFTALGGATLGTDFISFRIYRESDTIANGWDPVGIFGDDLVMESGAAQIIDGTYVMYTVNQNNSLTTGESPHTYYLTVNVDDGTQLQEGISVDIAVGTITVTGVVSGQAFTNTGSFAGNNTYKGGGVVEEAVLRLGLDRHTFYDGSEYWLFYIDDEEDSKKVWFKTSPDGVDWTAERTQVSVSATNLTSMGIHEDGEYIYVTYTSTGSYIRKITIDTKFKGVEYDITSMMLYGNSHPQVVIDSGGKLWRKGEER